MRTKPRQTSGASLPVPRESRTPGAFEVSRPKDAPNPTRPESPSNAVPRISCGVDSSVGVVSVLVVVCGLPGVGKSTVAAEVADRVDGRRLRTDVVRKEILPDPQYTPEETGMVYGELFRRAYEVVGAGTSVVLDGTFKNRTFRRRAAALAEELGVEFLLFHVVCETEVVRERIAAREGDVSDADFEVHTTLREQFEPIEVDHVTVDNSDGLDRTLREVRAYL